MGKCERRVKGILSIVVVVAGAFTTRMCITINIFSLMVFNVPRGTAPLRHSG